MKQIITLILVLVCVACFADLRISTLGKKRNASTGGGGGAEAYVEFNGTSSYVVSEQFCVTNLTIEVEARYTKTLGYIGMLFGTSANLDYGMRNSYGSFQGSWQSAAHTIMTGETNNYHTWIYDPYDTQTSRIDGVSTNMGNIGASTAGVQLEFGRNSYAGGQQYSQVRIKSIKIWYNGVLTNEYYAYNVSGTNWIDSLGNYDMPMYNCTTGTE